MARADRSYLEENGKNGSLRVRLRVSRKARPILGKEFLKKSLGHKSLARAQIQKHKILAEMRAIIEEAEREADRRAAKDAGMTPLEIEAMALREELEREERDRERAAREYAGRRWEHDDEPTDEERFAGTVADALGVRLDQIEAKHGDGAASTYAAIAYGRETPLRAMLETHLSASGQGAKFQGLARRAIERLEAWCEAQGLPKVVERITPAIAAQFEDEAFPPSTVAASTFQSYRSALRGYWGAMMGRGLKIENPWQGRKARRAKPHREVDALEKRPFTDDEVRKLLAGDAPQRLLDVMMIAALSGMRLGEICRLRARDCGSDGFFFVAKGKTRAGRRRVPIHSELAETLARLLDGKAADDCLIAGLNDPPEGSERSRASPVSKQFTRYRRKLGVDQRASNHPQAAADFHSFRRWFISKRAKALEAGAQGFTPWTLARVVGHDAEADGPLAMTMVRYAGDSSDDAMRACVEALGLPAGLSEWMRLSRSGGRDDLRRFEWA